MSVEVGVSVGVCECGCACATLAVRGKNILSGRFEKLIIMEPSLYLEGMSLFTSQ